MTLGKITCNTDKEMAVVVAEFVRQGVTFDVVKVHGSWTISLTGGY